MYILNPHICHITSNTVMAFIQIPPSFQQNNATVWPFCFGAILYWGSFHTGKHYRQANEQILGDDDGAIAVSFFRGRRTEWKLTRTKWKENHLEPFYGQKFYFSPPCLFLFCVVCFTARNSNPVSRDTKTERERERQNQRKSQWNERRWTNRKILFDIFF